MASVRALRRATASTFERCARAGNTLCTRAFQKYAMVLSVTTACHRQRWVVRTRLFASHRQQGSRCILITRTTFLKKIQYRNRKWHRCTVTKLDIYMHQPFPRRCMNIAVVNIGMRHGWTVASAARRGRENHTTEWKRGNPNFAFHHQKNMKPLRWRKR